MLHKRDLIDLVGEMVCFRSAVVQLSRKRKYFRLRFGQSTEQMLSFITVPNKLCVFLAIVHTKD